MFTRRSAVLLSALTLTVTGALVPSAVTTEEAAAQTAGVFLNEIHYSNEGVDTGEFVEVAGPAGADLTGLQVVLYDGDNGLAYDTRQLTGALGVNGVAVVDYPVEGIQDGPADAVALVDGATVVELLSWNGQVTAADGPATGVTSTDLGLAEGPETADGASLQLTGTGDEAADFAWTGPVASSPGAPNEDQTLTSGTGAEGPALPSPVADLLEPGDVVEKTVPASDPAIERLIEAESLAETAVKTGAPSNEQDSVGVAFSGGQQLRVIPSKAGDAATLTFQVPEAGRYRLWADQTRGSNFGVSTLAVDGVVLGNEFDGSGGSPLVVARRVPYGDLDLAEGSHSLTLTAVRAGAAAGWFIGLDVLRLRLLPAEGRLTLTPQRHDSVHGLVPVYGWSTDPADKMRLEVDHQDVVDWDALGDPAMLVYQGRGIEAGPAGADYADGISVRGQKTILNHDVGSATGFWTDAINISGELLHPGDNHITFFTGADPAVPGGPVDEFAVRNVQLILADGTPIPAIPSPTILPIGAAVPERVFTFTIPPAASPRPVYTPARGYVLDTQQLTDGDHFVSLVAEGPAGDERLNYKVTVDNGAPVVSDLSPAEGERVKGSFTLDAVVVDDGDRPPLVTATLDNSAVELGTTLTTDDLATGQHVFTVMATDSAGNTASAFTTFFSVPQTPDAPQLIAPEDGGAVVGSDAELQVQASDADGDPLRVTFLKATPVVGPPLLATGGTAPGDMPAPATGGGTPLDRQAAAESDDVYADAPKTSEFPYQRYDIGVSRVRGAKEVDVSWEGRVAPDREVVLSVWDVAAQRWTEVASGRGTDGADTTIVGTTRLGRALDSGRVHVLVHGRDPFMEIPSMPNRAFEDASSYAFSVAWFTDTQYLSQGGADGIARFGDAYVQANEWIKANAEQRKIVYAAHTGDLIENWVPINLNPARARREFQFASDTMKILEDAGVPNGVTPGNHDNKAGFSNDLYNEYFPPSRYDAAEDIAPTGEDGEGYYGGSWKPNDNQNHYDLIEAGGQKLIFLYLGYVTGSDEIDWANQVLAEYRDRKAVLLTHAYLSPTRAPDGRGGELTRVDGVDLFDRVVLPNENVFLTLSGHTHGVALNIKRDTGVKGRAVVEMLANYQFFEIDGEMRIGHLRLLQFNTEGASLSVDTYSPILNDFNANEFDTSLGRAYTESADEFVVPVDIASRTTGFSTDSIGLALRTDTVIGEVAVASGDEASVTWRGLTAGTRYGWYARATDAFGAAAESTAFSFTTGSGG